jgi:anaphase-promoting complex subunit 5
MVLESLACSGLRQHALLNLSRMHYLQHEHVAARKVSSFSIVLFITVLIYNIQFLTEAIEISRLAGDKETLQHCQGCVRHRTYIDSCLVMS